VDVVRSEALLSQRGFVPKRRRDDHERPWYRETVTVDLHHDAEHPLAFDFDVKRAWEHTFLSDFQGVPARLLAPAHELLFLCLHTARHRFARLSHILDLTFAFQKLPLPDTGRGSRRNDEIANLVAFGSMMAVRLDPRCTAQASADCSPRDREQLERLAGRLWLERMTERCPVIDWRAKHDFYLMMESRPHRRFLRGLRHLRILLTRLIDDDFAFAARFHLRQTWQVWLLRPVRILFHVGRAASSP
jgi:hypothetical protein